MRFLEEDSVITAPETQMIADYIEGIPEGSDRDEELKSASGL